MVTPLADPNLYAQRQRHDSMALPHSKMLEVALPSWMYKPKGFLPISGGLELCGVGDLIQLTVTGKEAYMMDVYYAIITEVSDYGIHYEV